MFSKKVSFILMMVIILVLTGVSVALAAPPWQAPADNSSLGDTLDLDETGKPNLGSIMSGRNNSDDVETPEGTVEPTAEGTVEPTPEGTVESTPEGTVEPTPEGTAEPTTEPEDGAGQHPVASALADYFGVPYDEIMGLHEAGNGFGNIAKAYFFADKLGMTPSELLEAAHGSGWGNILKEAGIHHGNGGGKPEKAGKPEKDSPPGQDKKGGDGDELTGQDDKGNKGGNDDKGNDDKGNGNKEHKGGGKKNK